MKVLALSGSPRKKGNSETMLAAFLAGVEAGGGQIELLRLCDLDIHPCIGCGGCDKTGKCVINDEMRLVYPKILAASRLVLASPIYFYGLTAQAKAFVDRCQALWNRKRLGLAQEALFAERGRKGFLLAVSASHGERVFEGAKLTARYAFDAMEMQYGGEVTARGFEGPGELAKANEILNRAELAGREFVD